MERAGFDRVVRAVAQPDAREHLRGGIRGGVETFAAYRDVCRALYSMAKLDDEAVGGAIRRLEEDRRSGMRYLARRLDEQGLLCEGVTRTEAARVLWVLTSFDAFDLLREGQGMSPAEIADLLIATAERSLLR